MIFKKAKAFYQSGFTLIEVLVALAIVSVALVALVKASINNVRYAERIRDKTVATWLATSILSQIELGVIVPPMTGDQVGHVMMLTLPWQWHLTVMHSNFTHIQRYRLDVTKAGDADAITTVTTYVKR